MRDCNQGRFRQQISFLRRQFLQDGELPFCNILSEHVISKALTAIEANWLDRIYSPLITLWDRLLTFKAEGDTFHDLETGSTWNIFGEAVSGELAGKRLEAVMHHNTFWFVWGAFKGTETLFAG